MKVILKIEIDTDTSHISMNTDGPESRKFTQFYKNVLTFVRDEFPQFVDYNLYINSIEWKRKAHEAKKRANYTCAMCRIKFKEKELQAHHITYERLGHERMEDIGVYCKDCHETIHNA